MDTEFIWNKDTWKVINSYFKENKYFVTKHQLDSYNEFLKTQLPTTIRQFNPIPLSYEPKQEKNQNYNKYEINVFIGGSLGKDKDGNKVIINDGKNVFIGKPVIYEDGVKKTLYPNEARLKNLTYAAPISASVYVQYIEKTSLNSKPKETIVDGSIFMDPTKVINHNGNKIPTITLGKIPIMLHTNACPLRNMTKETLYQMGECPYDQGGYFIIDGKEKVIVAQEFQAPNRIIVSNHNHDTIESSCSIRSEDENTFEPARTTKIVLKNKPTFYKDSAILSYLKQNVSYKKKIDLSISLGTKKNKKVFPEINSKDKYLSVLIPNFKREIPLIVLFRALGVITDKSILEHIVYDVNQETSKKVMKVLEPSLKAYRKIYSKQDAFKYIRTCCMDPIYDIDQFTSKDFEQLNSSKKAVRDRAAKKYDQYLKQKSKKEHYENIFIVDNFNRCFLPHVGKDFKSKAFFLGYMTNKIINVNLGISKPTDRDSYLNKRVHISGLLIAALFRDLYFRFKNAVIYSINRAYNSDKLKYQEDITTLINSANANKFFKSNTIDEGFIRAFKVCWNLKGVSCEDWQKGVVQDLNRLSYVGSTSHLRRIHTPIPKGAKIRAPHSLHLTTWGMFCPSESPDGSNIGIIKHLSLTSMITFGCNSSNIRKCVRQLGLKDFREIGVNYIYYLPKVFINGDFVGVHKQPKRFVNQLRLLRRNAKINIYTSISWNVKENEIHINTDEGRCCRPVYIVKNNNLLVNTDHINNLKSNPDFGWFNLLGSDNKNYNEYSCDYDSSSNISDLKDNAVVEYIDVSESDSSFIAMFDTDLKHDNVNYTHCEIHPSLILGIQASTIPFIENNQAPRNLFSGAQGKQAVGVYATNFYNRLDAESRNVLYYPQKPLVTNRLCDQLNINKLTYGENTIVAIACYTGYNQEDAVIVNKSALERGLFRTLGFRTYESREEVVKGTNNLELFKVPDKKYTLGLKTNDLSNLDENTGIINTFDQNNKPIKVHEGDILIGKVATTEKVDEDGTPLTSDSSVYIRRREYGIIDRVYRNRDNDGYHYCKVKVRKIKIPDLGDKFASRHGQKGTIGIVLNQEDMPVTKEGITPDIIVNPHAIPSRMTVGQLIECIMGKTCCRVGAIGDATAFTHVNADSVADLLQQNKYEKYGNETLYNGRTGCQLKCSIFIGPTYYQRLKHMSGDKYNSRGGNGPRTMLTRQPTSGRANGGGLRIGEMERDALLSHGVTSFLKESMVERSDGPSPVKKIPVTNICNKTGLIGIVNKEKSIYMENGSNNKTNFSEVHLPYACKLFLQELQSMCIAPRLITEKSANKWKNMSFTYDETKGYFKDDELYEYISVPGEFINMFKKRNLQTQIIKDTGIIKYHVDNETNEIKIFGDIESISNAIKEIKLIVTEKSRGTYETKFNYYLPNSIIKELKAQKFRKLNLLKETFKLNSIDISVKKIRDPENISKEHFFKITVQGMKRNIDKLSEELNTRLNNFRNLERMKIMHKKTVIDGDKFEDEEDEVSDDDNVGLRNAMKDRAYDPRIWETNIDDTYVNRIHTKTKQVINVGDLGDPFADYYEKSDFLLRAQIGKYIHLVSKEDLSTDIYIDTLVYLPDDDDNDEGVYLDKPHEINWYTPEYYKPSDGNMEYTIFGWQVTGMFTHMYGYE